MKSILASALTGVCLFALAAPIEAQAQAAPPEATQDDPAAAQTTTEQGVIIVTARRRDESIQDVPSVVNAVTAQEVADLNIRDFTEVKSLVPGLQLANNANGIGGNAQIRGVNFDINASGNNPTVEFYFNDAPITAGVILQQMYDVGQIEVLRGPQGTLRGRASPSGSITVTTRKPDLYDFGFFADLTANDIGTMNAQGGINIPVIKGVLGLRASGVINQDNFNNVHTIDTRWDGRDPYSETRSGRIIATLEPVDWFKAEGMYQRIDRFNRGWDQVESFSVVNPSAPPSPVLILAEDMLSNRAKPRYVTQIFDIYNWRAEGAFAGQRLIYQGQYYTQKIDSAESQDGANLFPTTNVYQYTAARISSESHEVRLQNDERIGGVLDYVVGFFDNSNNTPTSLNSPTVVRLPLAFGGGVAQVVQTPVQRLGNSHERSYFGNVTAHFGGFQVSGGARYIDYHENSQLLVNGALLTDETQDYGEWIYSGSLQYNFSPNFMVYASTGTSWRPGLNIVGDFNVAKSALENSFLNIPAESSESYEIGFKSDLFDKRLRFNVSAFHQNFENFPYRAPGSGVYYVNTVVVTQSPLVLAQQVGQFNFVGAVPVEVNGVEAELSGEIMQGWNAGLVASYSLGKIKNGVIPCNDLNGDGVPDVVTSAPTLAQLQAAVGADNIAACTVNQRSAFLPPFTATLQSEYNFAVSDHIDAYVRGLLNFQGASQGDPTNAFDDVDAYALVNLFAGVRAPDGMWEVTLYAKNAFDELQVLTRTTPLSTSYQQLPGAIINGVPTITGRPSGATTTSTYTGITTTPQQEFGINLKFRFGSR